MFNKIRALTLAGLLGTGCGVWLGYGPLLHYKTNAILGMSLNVAEYKQILEFSSNPDSIRRYLTSQRQVKFNADEINSIVASVTSGNWASPIPRLSKADLQQLPTATKEDGAVYMGIFVHGVAKSAGASASKVTMLGDYIKDSSAWISVRGLVYGWMSRNQLFKSQAAARRLELLFNIDQARARVIDLKRLAADYPDSGKLRYESSQVMDIRKDTERYMSPLVQLIGTEAEIISIKEQIGKIDREIAQEDWLTPLLIEVRMEFDSAVNGQDAISKIYSLISEFQSKAKTADERERAFSMESELRTISQRLATTQFVVSPAVPEKPAQPRPLLAGLIGTLLSTLACAFYLWRDSIRRLMRSALHA